MTQTIALLVDSYRELNSKKLFWITLILSGVLVLGFLGVGINDLGINVFGFEWHSPMNTKVIEKSFFYKTMFFTFGVNIWLTWAATILALISTAGLFPDLLSGGSIDLYLSKPISRFRLFLTKYAMGLLFVALQVGIFTTASFFVLGIRGGTWLPRIFIAIPIVLAFFSYLYSVCVFIGVMTRSTIAAILLTIVFWFLILGFHGAEMTLFTSQIKDEIVANRTKRLLLRQEQTVRVAEAANSPELLTARTRLNDLQNSDRANEKEKLSDNKWHGRFYAIKTVLPKTSETVGLLNRWLISGNDVPSVEPEDEDADDQPHSLFFGVTSDDALAEIKRDKLLRARPVSWVLGTSLAFEVVVLGFAAWIFCRRDY